MNVIEFKKILQRLNCLSYDEFKKIFRSYSDGFTEDYILEKFNLLREKGGDFILYLDDEFSKFFIENL